MGLAGAAACQGLRSLITANPQPDPKARGEDVTSGHAQMSY
jgi:hypothetical protein